MSLELKINALLKDAMKAKNESMLRGLRAIKAAILLAKTSEGFSGEISTAQEMAILSKLLKQRKDSLAIYEQQNRPDLAQKEQEEIAVIEQFMPQELSPEALSNELQSIINELNITSAKEMGKAIKLAGERLAGQAQNKDIAETLKKLLS